MAVETLSNANDLRYWVDEHGCRHGRTEQEIAVIKLGSVFKDVLAQSTLSDDDKQRLRRLSADYALVSAQLPGGVDESYDYDAMRRAALEYFSADLPLATKEDTQGFRRSLSETDGVAVMIDGRTLSLHEIELMYAIIEPSSQVLDRATEDSAYFYVPSTADDSSPETLPNHTEPEGPRDPAEYDFDYFEPNEPTELPAIEQRYTLRDELKLLGGTVISLVNRRRHTGVGDTDQQKIAS